MTAQLGEVIGYEVVFAEGERDEFRLQPSTPAELQEILDKMNRGEFNRVGACFYTRIKWDGGVELSAGASPQVLIGEKKIALICGECNAKVWLRYDTRVNIDEYDKPYTCVECTQRQGEVRAYYRDLLDSSEFANDEYDGW